MKRLTVGKFILILLLGSLLAIPALLFSPYQPLAVTGPYAIGSKRYTYTDMQRLEPYSHAGENRRVNVVIWYPEISGEADTYPLIVFSHGGLSTESSNESLYRELASHGYVVCSIGHPYHAFWTKGEDGHMTFLSMEYFGEIMREDARSDKEQSYRYYQKWLETRTSDINFVIDSILAKAAGGANGVYALVDSTRIGVMGHSLGGSAALAIPRQRNDVAAVIALESPLLYDIIGVKNGEFAWLEVAYPVPVLNIYSDSSWSHLSEWSQYGGNAALLSNPLETTINLYLPGEGHFSLTDLALARPLLTVLLEGGQHNHSGEEYLREVNLACLDFFDRYLKNAAQTRR